MRTPDPRWIEANHLALVAELEALRARLTGEAPPATPPWELATPSAADAIQAAFQLSGFERAILLLCAGVELDTRFAEAVGAAQGHRSLAPTFGLALAALPDPHWSALTPDAPLRRARLISVADGPTLTLGALRISERVLHHLAGVGALDPALLETVRPLAPPDVLPPCLHASLDRVCAALARPDAALVALHGDDPAAREAVVAAAGARLGMAVWRVAAADLPAGGAERRIFASLWAREAALGAGLLLVELGDGDPGERAALLAMLQELGGQVALSSRDPLPLKAGAARRLEIPRLAAADQRQAWKLALGALAPTLNGQVESVSTHFDVGLGAIVSASRQLSDQVLDTGELPDRALWDACRIQSRPRLSELGTRVETGATWDDLVLPDPQRQLLRDLLTHARHRSQVYETWGFGERGARGLGIAALFSGPSGTGKTLAAEILARELRLDLYRIDLSQVVSKYIGETEKNLRRVFDAADEGGAVLLFDEADALFGKRSEVRDSHDRYANIEVSYLLQRMEAYRGLAILTTNLKSALDTAFQRRLRFIVQFPFPDALQRAEIWRRVFPAATPTRGLDVAKLARLGVAGGSIRNIAVAAAFLAADAGRPVEMADLVRAARAECAKIERPVTDSEIGGWV